MKKILATSILFTLFVTATGCGHMAGHKDSASHTDCACEKSNAKCSCADAAKKSEKGCTECAGK